MLTCHKLNFGEINSACRYNIQNSVGKVFLPEASFGLRVLSSPASVCLSVCLCVCINHLLVRTITHQPFTLESPNLDERHKTPWLRCLLFLGVIDLDLQGQIQLESRILPHFELVRTITFHSFKVRITKFGPEMHLSTVKKPIVWGVDWPWSAMSNLTCKSKFISFWACPCNNLSPVQATITKFGPEMHLNTVKISIDFGHDKPSASISFLPEASFGLRVLSLPPSVCLCVRQSLACPRDNLSPVQARITKFGPEEQNTLVKIPIVLLIVKAIFLTYLRCFCITFSATVS